MESTGQVPATFPEWLDAETASDVAGLAYVLPLSVAPLDPGQRITGVACTALAARDDNGVVQEVLAHRPQTGDILVVAGASASRHAIIGDLTARELHAIGFTGLITDGPVRDAEELKRLPLQVWCRVTTPLASRKDMPGHLDIPVSIGGVTISPGDTVIASAAGVVIWPRARVAHLLAAAEARHESDARRLAKIEGR